MKLFYILLTIVAVALAGYFVADSFDYDNATISVVLIDTLFVLIPITIVAVAAGVYFSIKRRQNDKDVMTIRQYYQYKSAR
ncbi:hypothetical protein ACLI1A_06930 [Flavobacterium sp. RHBU_3]|uniref:hypothetical protein n=1 Tax=Flavobacterium sp. RHBU_3 TaxID=3391184 RepID=UPI003984CD57